MKKLQILLSTILVAIGVALTYFYFEYIVHHSITYVWDTWLGTENTRWLVIPACLVISLVFFGLQHRLDPKSETHESEGLGDMPKPTVANFVKVLFIGFFSLLAGASLGPEAILVPACTLLGAYVGVKLFKKDAPQIPKLLAMVGFIALFAAFFHSFIAGILGLVLVKKQLKLTLNPGLIILAVIASATTVLVLDLLDSSAYMTLPDYDWGINIAHLFVLLALALGGFVSTYGMSEAHRLFEKLHKQLTGKSWVVRGLLAGAGLSVFYLLGGPLVEFTGNESVVPMLQQAADLGLWGLVWILFIKVCVIAWSKSMGYRGGMIFPTVFVASVLVAIAQIYNPDINFIYGLIFALIGAFVANSKTKILL